MTLDAELVKQRFLHHRPLVHHRPVLPMSGRIESELHIDSNADFFNGIGEQLPRPSWLRSSTSTIGFSSQGASGTPLLFNERDVAKVLYRHIDDACTTIHFP
ncbi:hypothetical protein [Rhizobium laguerreae]|uniref:hypothetical protein n=1 Tax=Rhizobium laguerreae TaxID=1076926 RepID=UPI001C9025AF|nr:hypothetical protein [Rhizobium laguerreae]MBY3349063.1 hypothetical protein [Rhizobium laguerreae]MBY3356185.1 hypothetical protein [Rhizobium laguerreae]MBY3370163.1 hypothetical protein [Rhizobium laguerreae]MBY3377221.1 hypothetical protein [Rhizobium laguerreae]MBY3391051.1 hypothetical protein [Rhizobium laguerreae]